METCETCALYRKSLCPTRADGGRDPGPGDWCGAWKPKVPAAKQPAANVDHWPSVTQVMSPWTAQALAAIPEKTLSAAAERGTAVHDVCSRIALGEFIIGIDEGQEGYVRSFEKWLTTQVKEVILAERRLYHDTLCFHGKPDLIVLLNDERRALVDLKTPVAHQKSWAMQLAAYGELAAANSYHTHVAGTLRLDPAGKTPKMKWYEDSGNGKATVAFSAFLSALSVWNFLH